MDGWTIITTCFHCGGTLAPYKAVTSAPSMLVEFCGGSLPMVTTVAYSKCPSCGLVVQTPRMSDERINHYYSSGLYRETLGLSADTMDADEKKRSVSIAAWLLVQNVRPASHLDIGSSRGYLLRDVSAPVQCGYDMNPSYAGDTPMRRGQLYYELVSSVHVLEHTAAPLEEIEWYKSLTAKYLLIEIPGEHCTGGPLRFAHLFYFPPAVLTAILERVGFEIISIETTPNTRILCRSKK
jgi:hypothetical protein